MANSLKNKYSYTPEEKNLIQNLKTPRQVQLYLHYLPYNWEKNGETQRSFRRVVRDRTAHCLEAVFFAAAILENHGHPPLVLDLSSIDDLDHCLFLYEKNGLFGTVGVSRERELYGKPARFPSVRDLVMSYYDDYISDTACLNGYAVVSLDDIPRANWRFSERNIWVVEQYLSDIPHRPLRRARQHIAHMRQKYAEPLHEFEWRKLQAA